MSINKRVVGLIEEYLSTTIDGHKAKIKTLNEQAHDFYEQGFKFDHDNIVALRERTRYERGALDALMGLQKKIG